MRTLHTFFPKGFNLEGKSIHRNSCRIHKKNPMMWRIHPKSGNISYVQHSHISTSVWKPKGVRIGYHNSQEVLHLDGNMQSEPPLSLTSVPSTSRVSRVFASRDYQRRLFYLDSLMSQGHFSLKIFERYNPKILFRLLDTLENSPAKDLNLSDRHYIQLKLLLNRFLRQKANFQSKELYQNKELLITIFTSPSLDKVGLTSILRSLEVMNTFPHYMRRIWKHPLVAWKYVKTLGQKAFNYGEVGKKLSERTKLTILQEPCLCKSKRLQSFVDVALGHVVTTNSSFLPSSNLQDAFKKGTKFLLPCSKGLRPFEN